MRDLTEADVPACLALSSAANWNQNAADWTLMLRMGRGWGIAGAAGGPDAGRLIASTLVLPFAGGTMRFAWISMVLVLPHCRGQGLATTLLRHAIGHLQAEGIVPVLDATPAGFPVYRKLGFVADWGFQRYRREPVTRTTALPATSPSGVDDRAPGNRATADDAVRPLHADDWPTIERLDAAAFGGNRMQLLRALAARLPDAARVLVRQGQVAGYVLGRDGREAAQIGPLVAPDDDGALRLCDAALDTIDGPVYADLADHAGLLPALRARGFATQRPFTRMVLGAAAAPGHAAAQILMAGPELG